MSSWDDIRARSEGVTPSGLKTFCGVCYMSFFHGLPDDDGGGFGCPVHATEDERARMYKKLGETKIDRDHPLLAMLPRDEPS